MSTTRLSVNASACATALLAALACGPALSLTPVAGPTVSCELKATATGYAGRCEVACSVNALAIDFDGVDARRGCDGPPRSVEVTLARTSIPGRWLGTMEGAQPEHPTRLEVVPNKATPGSVARMPYGWFAIIEWRETAMALDFRVDARRQVRPAADDLPIIDRVTSPSR